MKTNTGKTDNLWKGPLKEILDYNAELTLLQFNFCMSWSCKPQNSNVLGFCGVNQAVDF